MISVIVSAGVLVVDVGVGENELCTGVGITVLVELVDV